MHAVVRNGNYGVTMFFVISGYLITSNARRRWGYLGAIDARTFYVSRTARIMPCLLLLLVLVNGLAAVSVAIFSNHAPLGVAVSFWLVNFASLTFWIAWPIAQSHVFGVTGIALGTAVLLINAHASGAPGSARLLAPLRWSGKLSYELYLFHLVVLGGAFARCTHHLRCTVMRNCYCSAFIWCCRLP